MSNLSDIGFPTKSEQDINDMIMHVLELTETIRCPRGFYLKYSDASGAEIWLQGNLDQELIGFNPHYAGKSRRTVCLNQIIERDSSELDGGFHAWANPAEENNPDSGEYPFVFDAPDFRLNGEIEFPQNAEIQLTAFASNDFKIYANEEEYYESQTAEVKFAAQSFVPSGLFSAGETPEPIESPRPFAIFAGMIKEIEVKTNSLTNEKFYAFLVETLGGEVDVAADAKLITAEPQIGGIVHGQFWLSGRLLESANKNSKSSLFKSLIDE